MARSLRARAWAHLHLPKFKAGDPACVSVKVRDDAVFYVEHLELAEVDFHVSQAGRLRALQEGRKNVHAWVRGYPVELGTHKGEWRVAKYRPQDGPCFYDKETGECLTIARAAHLWGSTVLYLPYESA